ncbi:hypothetical protein L917_21407 [Phytophthora nicotianae]|uniref:Uncharacterized protein n=1 Tax=Phytophthora nicotianae TaxID=4792 RepID=W2JZF1_PHYNI|nr:hypothetical protein L915_21685 [Phytophthora nicotianae]ETL77659.1 hypothetical protein L917_21407 [Phytophthora nicotianae]
MQHNRSKAPNARVYIQQKQQPTRTGTDSRTSHPTPFP